MLSVTTKLINRRFRGASMNRAVRQRSTVRLQHTGPKATETAPPEIVKLATLNNFFFINILFFGSILSYEVKMNDYRLKMLEFKLGRGELPEKPKLPWSLRLAKTFSRIFTGSS